MSGAQIWIMAAQFEIRQMRLPAARKLLGTAIGMCPKAKLFRCAAAKLATSTAVTLVVPFSKLKSSCMHAISLRTLELGVHMTRRELGVHAIELESA